MRTKLIALILLIFILIAFNNANSIDYSKISFTDWKTIKKVNIKLNIIDFKKKIDLEKVCQELLSDEIFSIDESNVIKKYKENCLFRVKEEDDLENIYISDILVFFGVRPFYIENGSVGLAPIFKDKYDNLLTLSLIFFMVNTKNSVLKEIIEIEHNDKSLFSTFRLINVRKEQIFNIGWVNENIHGVPEYSYIKLYKYNLLKKEVEIFDSYDYGIVSNGVDEVEGFFPVYDISHDQRYVYIPARGDREYIRNKLFNREKMKMSGGLYVFDWWQNKIYKLFEGNVVDVTNNTEDGYVYIKTMKYENNHHIYEYFRFKNPEEILEETHFPHP